MEDDKKGEDGEEQNPMGDLNISNTLNISFNDKIIIQYKFISENI